LFQGKPRLCPIRASAVACWRHREGRILAQMKKPMHAKHADGDSLNEPSRDAISFAFTVHNALRANVHDSESNV
jgi:hypothetical protein